MGEDFPRNNSRGALCDYRPFSARLGADVLGMERGGVGNQVIKSA